MSHYKPYPAYKDSGVEWIGKVPEHWDVAPFKWHIERNDGGVWGNDPSGANDTAVLRSTEQTVDGQWIVDQPALRQLSPSEKQSALLEEGDLVVTKSSGSSLHIGKTTLVTQEVAKLECCYSNFMQRLRMKCSFLPRLAWYVMNNGIAREQLDLSSNSTTGLANLNGGMIGQLLLAIPPANEQKPLVKGLDRETTRIDALIAKKTRFIELLKEKRQALITHAVTKGLDPTVQMKGSGVEWIGEVPEHWITVQLGKLAIARCDGPFGSGLKSEHYQPEGVRVIRLQNIGWASFKNQDSAFIAHDHWFEVLGGGHDVQPGDLLVAGLGDENNPLGRACVAPDDLGDALVKADCYRFRINKSKAMPAFLALSLSATARAECGFMATGATRDRLNLGLASARVVALPQVEEQAKIVESIDRATTRIDALIGKTQHSIDLLKERRSAFITAAVTGQIDLREEA